MGTRSDCRVFIVLGLHEPRLDLLKRQLDSLEQQTFPRIAIVASADGPVCDEVTALVRACARPVEALVSTPRRAGVHANFATGLRAALALSDRPDDLFAFCDQDDVWSPDKIERQVARMADPSVSLCHSDARVVSEDGGVIAPSLFAYEARSRRASFLDLLVMNSVSGMTALFRRDVAEAASSFPMARCRHILHDHWVALVAALLGRIDLVDASLVDYTQHPDNALGARDLRRSASVIRRSSLPRRAYLRRCIRQFLWRRRALLLLRHELGSKPEAVRTLSAPALRRLFECDGPPLAGLASSWSYRVQRDWRRADQAWRVWRGKREYCARPSSAGRTSAPRT